MKHVLLLFGGASNEHDVSLRSAAAVWQHIPASVRVSAAFITKDGQWFLFHGTPKQLAQASVLQNTALLSPLTVSLAPRGFCTSTGEHLTPDVIFPVLHGQNCEDGRLQGFLDTLGIPYVGCGCLGSALGMDKEIAKLLAASAGVPVADWLLLTREQLQEKGGVDQAVTFIEERFSAYPVFVKAVNSGSSVGAYRADDRAALKKALIDAADIDGKILVEEFICGKEIEVAVLERGGKAVASVPGEIEPCADFYDYDAKYKNDTARYHIPARLTQAQLQTVSDYAVTVFRRLGCRHLSRVDFFVTESGRIIFNEINTLPGFTSISMYPKLMAHCGISFEALVNILIEEALGL